jgi:putative transposase
MVGARCISSKGANDGKGMIYRALTTEQFQKPVVGSIPSIIRSYKATVTCCIQRGSSEGNIWQRNYHEHIIRDHDEYNCIHFYIEANIDNWMNDEENPLKSK